MTRLASRFYLAYIAGVRAFQLVPRATLEIPGGERRLDRILGLLCADWTSEITVEAGKLIMTEMHPPVR